jgi:hypothetical protein
MKTQITCGLASLVLAISMGVANADDSVQLSSVQVATVQADRTGEPMKLAAAHMDAVSAGGLFGVVDSAVGGLIAINNVLNNNQIGILSNQNQDNCGGCCSYC